MVPLTLEMCCLSFSMIEGLVSLSLSFSLGFISSSLDDSPSFFGLFPLDYLSRPHPNKLAPFSLSFHSYQTGPKYFGSLSILSKF